jgi:hypothetical protein
MHVRDATALATERSLAVALNPGADVRARRRSNPPLGALMLYTPDEVFGTDRSLWLTTSMRFGARLWLNPLQRKPNLLMPVRVIS